MVGAMVYSRNTFLHSHIKPIFAIFGVKLPGSRALNQIKTHNLEMSKDMLQECYLLNTLK